MYKGVLISGCWNRGVPLYTEVSSFQEVVIESSNISVYLRNNQICIIWYFVND